MVENYTFFFQICTYWYPEPEESADVGTSRETYLEPSRKSKVDPICENN